MKKKMAVGALVMVAALVVSVPLGAHNSLSRLREAAEGSYYYDDTGFALYHGFNERIAAAENLITLAQKYETEHPNLTSPISKLEGAVKKLENSYENDSKTFQANLELTTDFDALAESLGQVALSEEDAKHPTRLTAQMKAEQDKISRSSYNDDAEEFNARLRQFPVSLLRPVIFVEDLQVYRAE